MFLGLIKLEELKIYKVIKAVFQVISLPYTQKFIFTQVIKEKVKANIFGSIQFLTKSLAKEKVSVLEVMKIKRILNSGLMKTSTIVLFTMEKIILMVLVTLLLSIQIN